MPLRLLIADDHPMLVDGVSRVLEEMSNVQLLKPVENGRQLQDCLQHTTVDLLLLDLNMPHFDGIAFLQTVKRTFPHLKVIVFTSYNQPKIVREIRKYDADGYLLKTSHSGTIKEAVIAVAAGKKWFEEEGSTGTTSPAPLPDNFTRKYKITKRETEIIRMIAQGLTSKEISNQLFVSEFTVNAHRRNICRKLDIYTPVGLLNFAKEQGII